MRPSPGHRSRTLDLVPTGGLSRSGASLVQAAASLGQGGMPSGNNLRVATTLRTNGVATSDLAQGGDLHYLRAPSNAVRIFMAQIQLSNTGGNLRLEPDGRCTLHMNSLACTVS